MLKSKLPKNMIIKPPESQRKAISLKKYFLKDPNADLFINLEAKILPVHRSQLHSIPYIQRIPKNEKIHIIREPINIEYFIKLLAYYYGEPIIIEKLQELQQYLIICDYFQITTIPDLIQKKLLAKPFNEEIQIFILLQIAYSYNLAQVFKYCMEMLEEEEFQQINYNKFDFMYVDFQLFQVVIRRHHRLKKIQNKIKGLDEDVIEDTIKLYCKLQKLQPQIANKLIKKYINSEQKVEKKLKNMLKGPTLSSEKDSSSIHIVNNSPKRSEADQNFEENNLLLPPVKQNKQRKYSDGIEIFKVETSTDEGTKIYGSGRIKQRSKYPLMEQIKIKEETDEENLVIEEIESPQIKISPVSGNPVSQALNSKNQTPRIQNKVQNILKIPLMRNSQENLQRDLSADPDQLMDKVSQLLDHYKSAYQLHQSNMFTLKKRFAARSSIHDIDPNRRFSAGPNDAPYRQQAFQGLQTRLTNTLDMAITGKKGTPFKFNR